MEKNKHITNLAIPYMGSKRKLSSKILDFILKENPECEYIWDLFGGGGAISFEAIQRPIIKKVFYNEINTGVVELLKKIKNEGLTEEFYQFIDRDTFHRHKNDDTWFGGLCKVIWSFGNNQNDYMFGKDIERYKMLYHKVVVDDKNHLKEMSKICRDFVFNKYGIDYYPKLTMPTKNDYQERRLEIRKQLNLYEKECKVIQRSVLVKPLRRLQQLERLQQLQQLRQLEQLQQLEIYNLSYKNVTIKTPIDKTIIYLDPPYEGTGKYQADICHKELWNYVKISPYKVYISGYDNVPFKKVASFDHRTTFRMDAGVSNKKTVENLYCNRRDN